MLRRLGSDFDGEVIAAAHAITRTLKPHGLNWCDLTLSIGPQREPPRDFRTWKDAARFCISRQAQLTDRELEFLTSLIAQRWAPSQKQRAWLDGIVARLRRE
jgi:hypothetical protein